MLNFLNTNKNLVILCLVILLFVVYIIYIKMYKQQSKVEIVKDVTVTPKLITPTNDTNE